MWTPPDKCARGVAAATYDKLCPVLWDEILVRFEWWRIRDIKGTRKTIPHQEEKKEYK